MQREKKRYPVRIKKVSLLFWLKL